MRSIVVLSLFFLALPAGAEDAVVVRTLTHLGNRYRVVTVRPGAGADIRLYGGAPGGVTFAEAAKDGGRQFLALMNGGMYGPDLAPVGLFIANGKERHPINLRNGEGNFFLKPNGIFWTDAVGAAHVTASEAFPAHRAEATFATQSGPLLLIDGIVNPALRPESSNALRRNGVGVSADGKTAYFGISKGDVRFYDFATLFRDALGCRNALYLDGVVSRLWTDGSFPADRYAAAIAVVRKTK